MDILSSQQTTNLKALGLLQCTRRSAASWFAFHTPIYFTRELKMFSNEFETDTYWQFRNFMLVEMRFSYIVALGGEYSEIY